MKKIIATIMTLALVLGLCSATAFAADDIVLEGDAGFIKEWSASGADYKYLGYVSIPQNTTADYKYLQLTYSGDISMLRIEFNTPADTNDGPYWFAADQVMKFVTADGSAIPTKVDSPTTVVIDLAASGIADISKYANGGMHIHYLNPDAKTGSFKVTDARFMTSTTSAGNSNTPAPAETKAPSTNAAKTGSTSVPTVAALLVVVCAGAVLVYSKKRA